MTRCSEADRRGVLGPTSEHWRNAVGCTAIGAAGGGAPLGCARNVHARRRLPCAHWVAVVRSEGPARKRSMFRWTDATSLWCSSCSPIRGPVLGVQTWFPLAAYEVERGGAGPLAKLPAPQRLRKSACERVAREAWDAATGGNGSAQNLCGRGVRLRAILPPRWRRDAEDLR